MDAATQSRLQELFRRESRTLLQYAREAVPWAADKDRHRADRLAEVAASEAGALEEVARFLDKQHLPLPPLGAFPSAFTNYNFIAVGSLLTKVIDDGQRALAELRQDVEALHGPARQVAERFLNVKEKNLAELKQL